MSDIDKLYVEVPWPPPTIRHVWRCKNGHVVEYEEHPYLETDWPYVFYRIPASQEETVAVRICTLCLLEMAERMSGEVEKAEVEP